MTRPACIWCHETLPDEATPTGASVEPTATLDCACGVSYSLELVEQVPADVWERIRHRDGYKVGRDGRSLWVTPPAT